MKYLLILLTLIFSSIAYASIEGVTKEDEGGWVTRDGTRVQNTDNMKSIRGFGGWLVVTPDTDWEEKWNTPTESTPQFSEAKNVKYGQALTILPFFINPKTNDTGEANILCSIKVTRPDGSLSINEKDLNCFSGELQGNPQNIRLTTTIINYIGEDGDPPGIWLVEFEITDTVRNVTVPLKTQFTLVK